MKPSTYLTKSRYMYFLQCPKRLWLYVNRKELATPPTPGQQLRFDEGNAVGKLAQEHYIGGVLAGGNFGEAVRNTPRLLEQGERIIYEATFSVDGIGAMVDVLSRRDDGSVDLIEVKSSTKVKPEYKPDVAFQTLLVRKAGLEVNSASLMHVNNQCSYPDFSNFFTLNDLTDEATAMEAGVVDGIVEAKATLMESEEPVCDVGYHCSHPYDCPFIAYCHQDVPKHSVFTIPRIGAKVDGLVADGIMEVCDVTDSCGLNAKQMAYVDLVQNDEPIFNEGNIRSALSELAYPLYFLDFEARHAAIPRFPGMRPYSKIAFQFSCHIMQEDGTVEHAEYLHRDDSDPREVLSEKLLATLGDAGTILMYTSYEEQIIKTLAEGVPDHREKLLNLVPRLWDLKKMVETCVQHPGFCGSYSIKKVLPVLVPELSYDALGVSDGEQAGVVWDQLIKGESEDPTQDWKDLLAYCKLDTEAMVRVFEVLELHGTSEQ